MHRSTRIRIVWGSAAALLILLVVGAWAFFSVEEPEFTVIEKDGRFQIREYASYILAEVQVDGGREGAGSRAFRTLFRYISGANQAREKMAMTAPVTQQESGEKMAMTAPVTQRAEGAKWAVGFVLPGSYTMETAPVPTNARVSLREVPARRVAVVRYSGGWSGSRYLRWKADLDEWIRSQGLTPAGEPVWARYNPPFMPWFLRRNEIHLPVAAGDDR